MNCKAKSKIMQINDRVRERKKKLMIYDSNM